MPRGAFGATPARPALSGRGLFTRKSCVWRLPVVRLLAHFCGGGGSAHLPAGLAAPPTRARVRPAPPVAPPPLTEPLAAVPPCPPHPAAWPASDSRPAGSQTPHGGSLAAAERPACQPALRGVCASQIF